jgi:hypothetical protein
MLKMRLDLEENYTALPILRIVLDASNSSRVLNLVQLAIQEKVPGARVASLDAEIGTKLLDTSTGTWVFEENYTVAVAGVATGTGNQEAVNVDFLSMNVSQPISLGGAEINRLGAAYLVQPLLRLPTTIGPSGSRWLVGGGLFLNSVVAGNTTMGLNILDFSWVPSLAHWEHSYSPLGSSSSWSLTPSAPFNVTVGIHTAESFVFPIYFAAYSPTLQVDAPARATFENGLIVYHLSSPADVIMPAIVSASLVIGVASFALERRLTAPFRVRRKKR